jgi:Tol biopolymer transport system component/tRNA A-37 threonylcarbamoyl transferase component Bud32
MSLSAGSRLGPYDIVAMIGAGGMGEVYRARDTKLNREVAIKVVPDRFASDRERLARFTREAQTLASLNHPNIAHIHGLEESGGVRALVMELVEGEDLAQRLRRGAIPLDEALSIAKQIAEALEAAHDQGVVHRDLKPANIKVRLDGTVKVLDFGLAKLAHPEATAGHSDVTASPTITSPARMTGIGVILGTAAYMAPEQAKGGEADKRSDIWAFGCVLYEMLAGRRAFDGEDMTDVLGAVVRLEPNWEAISSDVPQPVRTLLQSCLVKERRQRVAAISTALFVLDKVASLAPPPGTAAAAPTPRRPLWRRAATPVAAALVACAMAGTGVWFVMRPAHDRVTRTTIGVSGTSTLAINGGDRDLTITPDGSRVVYVGNQSRQLFVRALDALEPLAVFTGAPRGLFVSPDGQWIGFVDNVTTLKKVAVTGGPAVTLATLDGSGPRGAAWGPDDAVIVATNSGATGLQRVDLASGRTTILTRPDRGQGEADHLWPELLPGGRVVLFTIAALTGGPDAGQVAALDLQSGTRTILVRGASHAHYMPSGHLIYAAAGTLWAVAFDVDRLKTRGTPVLAVPDVVTTTTGGVDAVVAGDGTLAYVSGRAGAGWAKRMLLWVDRQGRESPIPAPPRAYSQPRLSPDGTRVAVAAQDQEIDIWVWDLGRIALTRVTFDSEFDNYPVWTRDGLRVIFSSQRSGVRNLFWQAADGTGTVERLTDSPHQQNAVAVSPDGRRLIFTETVPKTGEDVMQLDLDETHRVTPLVQSSSIDRNGMVSPDGRWLAYESNESGRFEIFVRPYPEVNRGRWQASTTGGTRPLWAPNGQELLYASPTGALMRVGVERGPSWAETPPTQVVKEGYVTIPGSLSGRSYDIATDGGRFLLIKESRDADQTAAPASLIVVQHWLEELKRLVPTK